MRSVSALLSRYSGLDHDDLRDVASAYWGDRGDFAYAAYTWANDHLFAGRVPTPLIQWAPTPWGKCLGQTDVNIARPIITLHPAIWGEGELHPRRLSDAWGGVPAGLLYTFDVVVHELLHLQVATILDDLRAAGGAKVIYTTSHDNDLWPAEVMRLSPMIDLPNVIASRTKRKRAGKKMISVPTTEGSITMQQLSTWPHSIRPAEHYREAKLPFDWQ